MFYKDFNESNYSIRLNKGDYKLVYEFKGSKEHLELVCDVMLEEVIKKYRVREESGCKGCKDAVSKRF